MNNVILSEQKATKSQTKYRLEKDGAGLIFAMVEQSTEIVNGVDLSVPTLPTPPRVTLGKPPAHLTVACVWWGDLYGVEYVERLRDSVARHLTTPYDFVCLTDHDVPDGVFKIIPPKVGPGWWQKVGLFRLFGVRILYLDLNNVIVGSLDEVVRAQEPFCMAENFLSKGFAAHNSSVMLWTPTDRTYRIFTQFDDKVLDELHGDQDWIWRVMRDDIVNFCPHHVVSYKLECKKIVVQGPDGPKVFTHMDDTTSILVFHGKPKPHEVEDELIVANWR